MSNFQIKNLYETRSDNPNLRGYKVKLNNREYIVYYDCDALKEVYFMSFLNPYFFSCRADMKTISHYYYNGNTIRRYENGSHNRNYFWLNGIIVCYTNDSVAGQLTKREYIVHFKVEISNADKIKRDLEEFLIKFNEAHMERHMWEKPL